MIVQEKTLTIGQLNGKLITLINNALKKTNIGTITVKYTKIGTVVYLEKGEGICISTEQDLTKFKEKIKDLYETR